MTAEERVDAAQQWEVKNGEGKGRAFVGRSRAIRIAEEHRAAGVAEVTRERDEALELLREVRAQNYGAMWAGDRGLDPELRAEIDAVLARLAADGGEVRDAE
jgi:hypothetical protein